MPKSLTDESFPPQAARATATDWHRFVLVELNGLATMLRYDAEVGGGRAGDISRRARTILDTLAWDPSTAAREAWGFVESELQTPEDAGRPTWRCPRWASIAIACAPGSTRCRPRRERS